MRITRKLALLVAVPLVAVVGFAGLAVVTSAEAATRTEVLRQLVVTSASAGELAHALRAERAAALLVLTGGSEESVGRFEERARASREAAAGYRVARGGLPGLPAGSAALLERVDRGLEHLSLVRDLVVAGRGAASATAFAYRIVIADLVGLREQVGQAGAAPAEVADRLRAAAAVSQAAEYAGRLQVVVLRAAAHRLLTPVAAEEITAARTGFVEASLTFDAHAVPAWRGLWEQSATGVEALAAQRLEDQVARIAPGARVGVDRGEWATALEGRLQRLREVESRVDADLVAEVTGLRDAQRRLTVLQSTAVVVAVLAAVGLAVGLGRPVVRVLRRLRDAAHRVAYEQLPAAVARLDDHEALGGLSPEEFADQATAPVVVRGRDELAEVGAAFNAVHREALRTAAGQALLRVHVGAMFVNLARRGQALAGRLTAALDEAEREEQDPARLRHLFTVDHLVTLLGRTNDSLLVLGGAAPAQVRTVDEPLSAVITAAQGQVEAYTRITTGVVDAGVVVCAAAVDDVVKLLAELLDNACRYSPPDTSVRVQARWLSDRVVVQVADQGIGIATPRREELNTRLASRPVLDLAAVRAMGLTVVGHIAARHHIRVELREAPGGGTIAEVTLPAGVFTTPALSAQDTVVQPRLPADDPPRQRSGSQPPPWPASPAAPSVSDVVDAEPVRLAIFEQVHSGWFTTTGGDLHTDVAAGPDRHWRTAADAGWRAAAHAAAPAPSGTTPGGLPVRRPGAQLVPGGVHHDPAPVNSTGRAVPGGDWRDPARVSASLAAYSRGLASGRAQQHTSSSVRSTPR